MPIKQREKDRLAQMYSTLTHHFSGTNNLRIDGELSTENIERHWRQLMEALREKGAMVAGANELLRRLQAGIARVHEKLDALLTRIETAEQQVSQKTPAEMKKILDKIVDDLNALEAPIRGFFGDVEQLRAARHPDAHDYHAQ